MAQTDETKRHTAPASDLDDSIFEILNSSRPTYPGGGPSVKKPATQFVSHPVARPAAEPTPEVPESVPEVQPVTEPEAIPVTHAAARTETVPTEPSVPEPEASAAQEPAQKCDPIEAILQQLMKKSEQRAPIQRPDMPETAETDDAAEGAAEWRPTIQPNAQRTEEPTPRLQKRPVISHALPEQEESAPTEVWPEWDELEEAPEPQPQENGGIFQGRKKKWLLVVIAYALILILGFSARFIIEAVRKPKEDRPGDSSSSQTADSAVQNGTGVAGDSASEADAVEIVKVSPAVTYLAVLEDNTAPIRVSFSARGTANSTHLQWESSDERIATVDASGTVTGVSAGTCMVTVSAKNDPEVSADVEVVVRHLEERQGCTYVDDILIVNKTYSLPESYDPGGLTPETAEAFFQMTSDAAAEGYNLYVGSDYRSYDNQVTIYQNYCARDGWEEADTYSGRPGHSEHQTGMTVDCNTIDDAFGLTPESDWLAAHCAEYGFIIRFPEGKEAITGYQYEPWHVRYVGTDIAAEIQELGICLEEYLGVESVYTETWPEDPNNPENQN